MPGNQGTLHDSTTRSTTKLSLLRRNDRRTRPRSCASTARGATAFTVGLVVLVVRRRRTLLRLHQAHPVHARLPSSRPSSSRRTRSAPNSPVRIAGVNVGKVTKIERQARHRHAVVTMEIDDNGLPIHKDATAQDPPAHLPRGQLLRRPRSRARRPRRRSTTATRSRSARPPAPVQLDQLLTALQQDTRTACRRARRSSAAALSDKPTPRRGRRPDLGHRGPDRGAVAQRRDRATAARRAARRGDRPDRAAWACSRDDLAGLIAGLGRIDRGRSAATSGSSRTSSRTSTRRWRRSPRESTNLQASIRRARADAADGQRRARRASTPRSRRRARSPARSCRASARRRRRSTPAPRGSRRPARSLSRHELRGLLDDLSPATATSPRSTDAASTCSRRRTFLEVPDAT